MQVLGLNRYYMMMSSKNIYYERGEAVARFVTECE